jgi:uncharacterized protein (DUF697 family)
MTEDTRNKNEKKDTNAKTPIDPTSEEIAKLIRKRAKWAAGVGLLGLPLVNFVGVTAIQVEMVKSLCQKYGKTFNETAAKNIISGLLSSGAIQLSAPVVGGAVLALPLVGFPLAVISKPVLNGVVTYAMGHVFATHFANGGSLIGVAAGELSDSFKSAVQEARNKMAGVIGGKQPEAEAV